MFFKIAFFIQKILKYYKFDENIINMIIRHNHSNPQTSGHPTTIQTPNYYTDTQLQEMPQ